MSHISRVIPLALAGCAVFAGRASAQAVDTNRAPTATVSGTVLDSIARTPLAGATIQLVDAANTAGVSLTATSDSLGRFRVLHVPNGRYMLGFFHPMLDSLGVEAPLREVTVESQRDVRADLATPSPLRLRAAICGSKSVADSTNAVVVGVVRSASDGTALSGVTVSGEWLEMSFSKNGVSRRFPHIAAITGDNGWFALCNVPSGGTMFLVASRGADSTDLLEAQVPADGFLRRELFLGAARAVVTVPTSPSADSLAPTRAARVGDATLTGTVVATLDGRPLPGAMVSVAGGNPARTNERGQWQLTDAPLGTRMLEVRALGFYPERRRIDVVANTPPVRVALSTLKAVLDTVRISATRTFNRDRNGFEARHRSGVGRFLTAEDIARRAFINTSDLFTNLPGIRLDRTAFDETSLQMRGAFGWCSPAFFIDGMYMRGLSSSDVDDFVRPQDVANVEIYTESSAPPQFQPIMSGCGSIVIWTKWK
jgi:hypothetical protein